MSSYQIPAATVEHEQVIRKSRFITFIGHAPDARAAQDFIADIRTRYPDARHVCWAYIAGEPGNTTAISCSDDGEPGGTAGRPMLNVLQHGEVGEIVAVVVRYFGGIKLGAGGLVRAYSSSVSLAMKQLESCRRVAQASLMLVLPFALEDAVRRALQQQGAAIGGADYGQQLTLACTCAQERLETLTAALNALGRGQVQVLMPE
ncbi:MAG: YigZ family protein [Thiothrix sp.]|nr:YigZ family protein [Thiothrix sp.]HPQ96511.1 YigZ family protein [Thiolinea sp.]